MAKKRTKKDKQNVVYNFSGFSKKGVKSAGDKKGDKKQIDKQSFFGYDLSLIYKDLTKTGIVTSVVVAVLLIILVYT